LPLHSPIILASASPRRQELLRNAGIQFEVRPANIPEVPGADETPVEFAKRMAREKAKAVQVEFPERVILAADTVVAIESEILGKPVHEDDAIRMLRMLSGRSHQVITGVCLITRGFEDLRAETTTVQFAAVSDAAIHAYVSTGEPMDKAGAYAIQGGAGEWIQRINGDYNNVVGLPLDLVLSLLTERGVLA
jgi:septum formation protein